jgi:hypothetical protein
LVLSLFIYCLPGVEEQTRRWVYRAEGGRERSRSQNYLKALSGLQATEKDQTHTHTHTHTHRERERERERERARARWEEVTEGREGSVAI